MGCAGEYEEVRVGPPTACAVVEVGSDERPGCLELGPLELTGDDSAPPSYESAYASLGARAAALGANYVVIDAINGMRCASVAACGTPILIRARAFACPLVRREG
jgi:hypothetical protein